MKKIFLNLVLIFLLKQFLAAAQPSDPEWHKIESPTNYTLLQLTFVDSITGWAAGEAGTIIRTNDGGNTWQIQNSSVQTFISDIFFLDKNLGWATTIEDVAPYNSIILKTTNGGDEWIEEIYPDSLAYINTIFFFDSLNGFIGGSYIAHTTDGGNSWQRSEVDSNMVSGFPVNQFNFYNRQFGYACGGFHDFAGVVWQTTNSGNNWTAKGVSSCNVFDLYILDSLNVITLSGDPTFVFPTGFIKTTDAGLSWKYEDLQYINMSFALDFRTQLEGWSASGVKFLFTSDQGETWIEKDIPDSSFIYDLQFTDSLTGYACGEDGVILKYGTHPVTVEQSDNLINEFYLTQNYPNPFNPSTVIGYQLPVSGDVTLKVFDVLGRDVATLVDEYREAGYHEIEFNPASSIQYPASGVYIYQLKAGSFIETKKMLLQK